MGAWPVAGELRLMKFVAQSVLIYTSLSAGGGDLPFTSQGKRNGTVDHIQLALQFYHRIHYSTAFLIYRCWLLLPPIGILRRFRNLCFLCLP